MTKDQVPRLAGMATTSSPLSLRRPKQPIRRFRRALAAMDHPEALTLSLALVARILALDRRALVVNTLAIPSRNGDSVVWKRHGGKYGEEKGR
jgi:hypothetical protein